MSKSRWILVGLVLALTLSCGSPKAEEVALGVPDGGFETDGLKGWTLDKTAPGISFVLEKGNAHGGEASLLLKSTKEGDETYSLSRSAVGSLPAYGFVKLTGYVKTTGEAGITLQPMKGDKPNGRRVYIPKESLPKDGKWNKLEAKTHIPLGTDGLSVICFLKGKGEAAYDDLSLEPISREPGVRAALAGPGIACAQGADVFKATKDLDKFEVIFPLPNVTAWQTPISFEVRVDPPGKLISSEIFHRSDINWNCRVVLGPIKKDEVIKMNYFSDVIMAVADFSKIPEKIAIPPAAEYPADVLPWLESTIEAQVTDPRIVKTAQKLMSETPGGDAVAYLKVMLAFPRTIKFNKPEGCDAVNMLEQGGACTSHANLAAALCRAVGIPARVIANYPTWNVPFQTHYIIEAYLQGYGWLPCESIMNVFAQQPFKQIFMSRVTIQDEKDSADPNRNAAPGVPKWSLNEIDTTTGLMMIDAPLGQEFCDHLAYPKVEYPADADLSGLVEKGRNLWEVYLKAKTGAIVAPALTTVMDKEIGNVPATPEALKAHLIKLEKMIPN